MLNGERKIILVAFTHELLQLPLALGEKAAADDNGKNQYTIPKLIHNDELTLLRRWIGEGAGFGRVRFVDVAMAGFKRVEGTLPTIALVVSGFAVGGLDDVPVGRGEVAKGLVEAHALGADEPNPVVS